MRAETASKVTTGKNIHIFGSNEDRTSLKNQLMATHGRQGSWWQFLTPTAAAPSKTVAHLVTDKNELASTNIIAILNNTAPSALPSDLIPKIPAGSTAQFILVTEGATLEVKKALEEHFRGQGINFANSYNLANEGDLQSLKKLLFSSAEPAPALLGRSRSAAADPKPYRDALNDFLDSQLKRDELQGTTKWTELNTLKSQIKDDKTVGEMQGLIAQTRQVVSGQRYFWGWLTGAQTKSLMAFNRVFDASNNPIVSTTSAASPKLTATAASPAPGGGSMSSS